MSAMATIDDVAAEILGRSGPMDTWKLQKLVYYSQAWHLVWDGEPLFRDRIEAWANGPVAPALYRQHRGRYRVSDWPSGDPARLKPNELETIEAVLGFYGDKPGHWLSELTHSEPPWQRARRGLAAGERGRSEISKESMAEYYGSLQ
jgi:uncharacterized phage-associated protein